MQSVAKTPAPPYYAITFTSVRTDGDNGYGDAAKHMLELVSQQSGFIGFETARQET
jgi:heme-degrading monooxygenase HmoA